MKLAALLPVQVGYGKNSNELTGALLHYQELSAAFTFGTMGITVMNGKEI